MKTNNSKSAAGRKPAGFFGTHSNTSTVSKSTSGARGRGRKKIVDDDKFADLNMGWETNNQDISSSWSGSAAPRKKYYDDAEADSYEGTGFMRGREDSYNDDELYNDPYETFRRG